jgi:hypothetical protein
VHVVQPRWLVEAPEPLRAPVNHAWAAKIVLPQLLPGYDIYFWFDADGWVQGERFFERYVEVARTGAVALVVEDEPVYPFDWRITKWDLGNLILSFGFWRGLRGYRKRVNAGFFAASVRSSLWDCWRRRYEEAIRRANKMTIDQHALKVALALDGVPMVDLGGAFNWICSRARPMYDAERRLFCVPYEPFEPIAVMHLAGTSKQVEYDIQCVDGGTIRRGLLFET